ncbi:hypothetical protein ACSW8S_18400 (plasmid) [Clostridium perfringens]
MKISSTNYRSNYYNNSTVSTVKESIQNRKTHRNISGKVDIQIKDFSHKVDSIKKDESLSLNEIEALRAELKNNPVTSEKLADALINYHKENSWQKSSY